MNFSRAKFFTFCFFLLLVSRGSLKCVTIGSDTTASRQLKTFFPAADTSNTLRGFAVFEKGLTLEDKTTKCFFDAFFPVSGDIVLNGGSLSLLRDCELKNPFTKRRSGHL